MQRRQPRRSLCTPVRYTCTRRLRVQAPADVVWAWMSDVRRVLRLNLFHEAVDYPDPVQQVGVCVPIRHRIWGLYRQTRVARMRVYRPYCIAWGELQAHGYDRFPHSQSFTILPVDAQSCMLVNSLRGQFRIPAARYWFLPVYRLLAPRILDRENRHIAAAVEGPHHGAKFERT